MRMGKPVKKDLMKLVVIPLFLGILVGGGILVYLIYSKSPAESNVKTTIVLPEQSSKETGSNEAAGQASLEQAKPKVEFLEVTILDTPTGYLNVRRGPGTNFEKITTVKPGEKYQLVSENQKAGWYEIKLDETRTGWVTKQYAKIE